MSRYINSLCKKCRRAGEKLFLKGERCYTPKCPFVRRGYPPGMHGDKRQRRGGASDYGRQLAEKQKVKAAYGVMERQFRNYVRKALSTKANSSLMLLRSLETRLDNVVFRLGLAPSRRAARQMVSHGRILVNAKKVDIPSFSCKTKDKISFKTLTAEEKETLKKKLQNFHTPLWLTLNKEKIMGEILRLPDEKDLELGFTPQLIIEYYSR